MLCPKCHQEIPDGTAVCPNCKTAISQPGTPEPQIFKNSPLKLVFIVILTFVFIVILATFAFQKVQIMQLRSKVYRAKADMRMLAAALESYYIDYSNYPKPDYDAQGKPVVPKILLAPIDIPSRKPYLNNLPNDPFSVKGKQPYRYFASPEEHGNYYGWIITSNGPNKKSDLDIKTYNPIDTTWLEKYGIPNQYDPTNGVWDSGDIWRIGP